MGGTRGGLGRAGPTDPPGGRAWGSSRRRVAPRAGAAMPARGTGRDTGCGTPDRANRASGMAGPPKSYKTRKVVAKTERLIYSAAMDLEQTARCLAELGNVARLRIFSLLVRAGDVGLNVGELKRALALPASTLAFHLRGLVDAGLVTQERQGREVRCRPDFARLNAAFAYFRDECCQGVDVPAPRRRRAAGSAC